MKSVTSARPAQEAESASGPRSPARVLQLLSAIAHNNDGATLAELTTQYRMPKSTVLSLLRALEHAGYLRKAKGTYGLGKEALKLGAAIVGTPRFPPAVRTALRELADKTGESALFATLLPDEPLAVYMDVVEASSTIRFTVSVGARRPLFCTAVGRALLAFQPESYQENYLRNVRRKQYTDATVTDKRQLSKEMEKIRKDGVAVSLDQMISGAGGIAAPVRDGSGNVVGTIAAGFPTARLGMKRDLVVECVKFSAKEVSAILGFTSEK